eukprot:SAG31_NODE_25953_length_451_cov_0.718750_1_plen_75_part_01
MWTAGSLNYSQGEGLLMWQSLRLFSHADDRGFRWPFKSDDQSAQLPTQTRETVDSSLAWRGWTLLNAVGGPTERN